MSFIWSEKIDYILNSGFSLKHLGVNNWALERDDALRAICELEAIGIPILGGDIYKRLGEFVESTYDNWYCNQKAEESDSAFLRRSSDTAKKYICSYLVSGALFSIVPKI